MFENIASDCACHAAYVLECEIVGNKAAPAVGTEFDLGHSQSLVFSR